ncbi:MAG: sigma 54-interacting transcriptional regulator, partial [Proteobacteria bacterium]|nr:sigma 54-interacting transcriptional regulator [Pseudomonadota bacterium]
QEEFVQLRATPIYSEDGEVLYMGETILPVSPTAQDDNALVGRSRPWLHLLGLLQRAAPTEATVMLLGESGVGKERAAEYLHQFSKRSAGPFMVLDCGAVNANLIESELFGHEKSAFTGAHKQKKGLFEAANGGTLFIDEIGEMPIALQTRLLRVLESSKVRRVGGTDYFDINVRVIAATNRKLEDMVEEGNFRSDLYYRLAAFPVHIPSLREHRDDIPALAEYFLSSMPDADKFLPLSPEIIQSLLSYDYPGNVRELRNIIERAAILADDGVLRSEHLMIGKIRSGNNAQSADSEQDTADAVHIELLSRKRPGEEQIMSALANAGGHRGKAAKLLGIGERSLYRYINDLKKKRTGD